MSKKKSKTNVEKLVDAQARGKTVKGTGSEQSRSRGRELDTRISKAVKWTRDG